MNGFDQAFVLLCEGMMLYKLKRMTGDHTSSLFEPSYVDVSDPPELRADIYRQIYMRLLEAGYTAEQTEAIMHMYYAHATYNLGIAYSADRWAYIYGEVQKLPKITYPPLPGVWAALIVVGAFALVAAGLYAWMQFESERLRIYPIHDWAYVMRYEERLFSAEIWAVSDRGEGAYELVGEVPGPVCEIKRNYTVHPPSQDLLMFFNTMQFQGRYFILWHRWSWIWWGAVFCGALTRVDADLFVLRKGGNDFYVQPPGWRRPGGRVGTPTYKGVWTAKWPIPLGEV